MNDICGRFHFAKDMNGDSLFTITDVWLMIKYVWLLPSHTLIDFIQQYPQLSSFFEIDCGTGEGIGGATFSAVIWFTALATIMELAEVK